MTQIPSKMNIESRDINTTTRTNYYHSTLKVLPLGSNHGNTSGWPLTLHSYIDSCIRALDQWYLAFLLTATLIGLILSMEKKIYLILPNLDENNYLQSCLKKSSQNLVVCRWKSYLQWIGLNATNQILIGHFTEVNQKNEI